MTIELTKTQQDTLIWAIDFTQRSLKKVEQGEMRQLFEIALGDCLDALKQEKPDVAARFMKCAWCGQSDIIEFGRAIPVCAKCSNMTVTYWRMTHQARVDLLEGWLRDGKPLDLACHFSDLPMTTGRDMEEYIRTERAVGAILGEDMKPCTAVYACEGCEAVEKEQVHLNPHLCANCTSLRLKCNISPNKAKKTIAEQLLEKGKTIPQAMALTGLNRNVVAGLFGKVQQAVLQEKCAEVEEC